MIDSRAVTLERATPVAAPVMSNLLELYLHDLSEIFPIAVGADGRFGYDWLSLYWSEPERRFAYLIRCGPRLAGFALATRGSPVSDDPEVLDVAEFFVLRSFRRSGVGRQAAHRLWNGLPGRWIVRVSQANRAGLPFWRATVAQYTRGSFCESERPGSPHAWRVFAFDSVRPDATVGERPAIPSAGCRTSE